MTSNGGNKNKPKATNFHGSQSNHKFELSFLTQETFCLFFNTVSERLFCEIGLLYNCQTVYNGFPDSISP